MKYEIIKGSEKDFEGAPEWCTHIIKSDASHKLAYEASDRAVKGNPWAWVGDGLVMQRYDQFVSGRVFTEIIAERRPITEPVVNQQLTTEWGDDGLPPVGALCRYRAFSDTPWVACEVLGWHGDEVWLKRTDDGITFVMGNPALFPIRSPEDVAREKERSEECDKIFGILSGVERTGNRSDMAEALYDAGYRKGDQSIVDLKIKVNINTDEAKATIAELCRSSASNGHSADLICDAIAAGKIPNITKIPTVSELMRITENATREDCEAIVKLLSGK